MYRFRVKSKQIVNIFKYLYLAERICEVELDAVAMDRGAALGVDVLLSKLTYAIVIPCAGKQQRGSSGVDHARRTAPLPTNVTSRLHVANLGNPSNPAEG